jgi:hypothetical protein
VGRGIEAAVAIGLTDNGVAERDFLRRRQSLAG